MKTISILLSLVWLGVASLPAQTTQTKSEPVSTRGVDTGFAVSERGPHHRVWSRVTWSTDTKRRAVGQTNSFVELATGLNFMNDKGEYEESSDEISILPDGKGAAASKGQHKVIFPPDVYDGQIQMSLPDGKWMVSRVLGLSYHDTASGKSVLIAETASSVGELHGRNVVIYPNALDESAGFQASIRYTNSRDGFEQDVILTSGSLPVPEEFGLISASTVLEVLTEFFAPPVPVKGETTIISKTSDEIVDERLDFGVMQMGTGKAFSQELGGSDESVPVVKQWLKMEQRDFLIEQVRFNDILPSLEKLPKPDGSGLLHNVEKVKRLASIKRRLPSLPRMADSGVKTKTIKQAMLSRPTSGLVLDYVTLNTSLTNYTFHGDTTYYLSGNVSLNGTNNTFESGSVLKYTNNVVLTVNTPVTWFGESYRPILMISKDDNTAGETIPGSTGNPGTSLYAANALYFNAASANTNLVIQNLRVANATRAISINTKAGHIVKNLQLVNCANGLSLTNADVSLRNALMFQVTTNFTGSSSTGRVEHLTSDIASWFNQNIGTNLFVTNSLLVQVTNTGTFTSINNRTNSAISGVFTNVGAGAHYLVTGSTNRNVGSTNINAGLLGDLKKLTTFPPVIITNVTLTVSTNWNPQAQRDTSTNDLPDVGYHYDPIDYALSGVSVTNSTLTLSNGVALGTFGPSTTPGIVIRKDGNVVSEGSPTNLNQIARYNSVQEQANTNWSATTVGHSVNLVGSAGKGSFRFTRWSLLGGKGFHFESQYPGLLTIPVGFKDCQFGPGSFEAIQCAIAMTNCLMERPVLTWDDDGGAYNYSAFNNLYKAGSFTANKYDGTDVWLAKDNLFDGTSITLGGGQALTHDYNGYVTNFSRITPNAANDKILTNSPIYQTGLLGRFYYPTNGGLLSTLINTGSRNATNAGLYHYTVTTNQVKETNSTVDIGFHYIATGTSGLPVDTDGDGLPDYLEDLNGNGNDADDGSSWLSVVFKNNSQASDVSAASTATFTSTNTTVLVNGYALVSLSLWSGSDTLITNVTYGGTAMKLLAHAHIDRSGEDRAYLWGLPVGSLAAGNYSIVVSYSDSVSHQLMASARLYSGINQDLPVAYFAAARRIGAAPTINLLSATNELMADCLAWYTGTATVGAGQTERWKISDGTTQEDGAGSDKTGAAAGSMSWTLSATQEWAQAAVSLMPVGGKLARILFPSNGARWSTPYNLSIQAIGYFSDQAVTNCSFYSGTNKLGESTVGTNYIYQWIWTNAPAGTNALTVVARGNQGGSLTSSVVSVVLKDCWPSVDVALVMDRSGSMATLFEGSITRLQAAKTASTNFVNNLNFTNDQAALVTFSDSAITDIALTNNKSAVLQAIGSIVTNNATYMVPGLAMGQAQLESSRHNTNALPVILFLSDGEPTDNTNLVLAAAAEIKDLGTRLVTVALGTQAATNLMSMMASPGSFYYATNATQLTNVYNLIAASLCRGASNQPPLVTITNPVNNSFFTSGTSIPINATASDVDGTVTNVQFFNFTTNLLGTATFTNSNYVLTWTNAPVGTNKLTAVAKDNGGLSTTSAPPVTVIVTSAPPSLSVQFVAPVNNQLCVFSPTNILLWATNTVGSITKMTFLNGSTYVGETNAAPYQFLWTNVTYGNYTLSAIGTNSATGVSATNTISIIVNAMPVITNNTPTNIQSSFTEVANVGLTNTAWDPDTVPNGFITNVTFYRWSNSIAVPITGTVISNNLKYSLIWTGLTNDYYSYYAVAKDNRGAQSTSPIGVFKVNPTNPPPTVSITYPSSNATFRADCDITITASATNYPASVTNVEFYVNGESLGNDPTYPYSITKCCWKPGTYVLTAKATDSLNARRMSEPVTITVGNPIPTSGNGIWDNGFGGKLFERYPTVYAMDVDTNGFLYVGADIIYNFGSPNEGIAKWDGTDWSPFFEDYGIVYVIKTVGNRIFAGGVLNQHPDYSGTNYVFQWDGTNWTALGDGLGDPLGDYSTETVRSIAAIKSDIYAGGGFTQSADGNTNVQYIARLSGSTWTKVGNGLTMPTNGAVRAIASIGNTIYIGGDFTAAGGDPNIKYIAKLVGTNWTSVGGGVNGVVRALVACDDELFVGGDFTTAGGIANANCIAKWDGLNWSTLGQGVGGGDSGFAWPAPSVHTISHRGNDVFVGGEFRAVFNGASEVPANHIAKATWSSANQTWTWSALDSGVEVPDPGPGTLRADYVMASAISENPTTNAFNLFVGGLFQLAGNMPAYDVARWMVGSTVNSATNLPSVTITNPPNKSVYTNPASITITAVATTSDGISSIKNVDFFDNGNFLGSGSALDANAFTFDWPTPSPGVHSIKARATDDQGPPNQSAFSSPILLIVKSTSSPNAVDDSFEIVEGSPSVTLDVLANDTTANPGKLSVIQVAKIQGSAGSIAIAFGGSSLIYTPNSYTYGTDVFAYSITDGVSTNTASLTVNVRAKPTVQITTPYDGSRFKTNVSIAITNFARGWNGVVTNVALFVNGSFYKKLTPLANGYSTTNWTTNLIGFYSFETVATDNLGITNISTPVTVILTNTVVGTSPVAVISNLTPTNTTRFGLLSTTLPVISDGFFNLLGTASGASPVAYQVLLYRPEDWESAVGSLSEWIAFGGEPFANITPPGTNNSQGFRIGSVVNGNLGTNDLSAIPNGVYDLVLRVRGGTDETNAIVRVQIDLQLKIGQFSFSEQDLAIPVNGIPLTVVRTYNSMNPNSGDFGASWTYALNDMDVVIDEDRVTATAIDTLEDSGDGSSVFNFSMRTGGGRNVTLTLPDGHRVTYQFTYASTTSAEDAPMCVDGEWIAPPGVTYTLSTPNPATKHSTGDDTVVALYPPLHPYWQAGGSFTPLEAYDIPTLVLSNIDGTTYYITRDAEGETQPTYIYQDNDLLFGNSPQTYYIKPHPGKPKLTKILQRSGDYIKITDAGIFHYNATNGLTRSVFIERDSTDRITAIRDPNSGSNGLPVMKYVYNRDTGNLIQVHRLQDRNAGTYTITKYHYDQPKFPHYITSIEDPRGVPLARNEYDDSGKLIAVVDADGKRTAFIHNSTNKVEIVTDRLGNTNSYVYDLKGNVTFTTNALGIVSAMAYDNLNHEIAVTNALGTAQVTWSLHTYDANGNQTQVVTSPNHTNSFTYDSFGNLLTQTDALGNISTNGYDGFGNLTNSVQLDTNGVVVGKSSSIYLNGHLVATLNANNQTNSSFSYDSMGNLTGTTDGNGVSRNFYYDSNGNQTNSSYTYTPPGGGSPVTVSTTTILDAQGRAIRSIDALGNTNQTFYNSLGKVDYTIDKFGNTNSFLYDPRGNLIQTTHADGLVTRTAFDDNGRAYLTTDRNGITGTRTYFDAAGRATNVVRLTNVVVTITDGPHSVVSNAGTAISSNLTEYLPSGWVKKRTSADGQPTTYAYWPDGQLMYVTNAVNQTTFYKYDIAGRQEYVADALNRTNRFGYDAVGRMVTTTYANNSYTSNYFNMLGQRTAVSDQAGLVTQFGYDLSGQLTNVLKPSVPDPVGGTNFTPSWTYKYDVYGRQTESIDPRGNSTTNSFDAYGRGVSRWLPLGGTGTTNYYNALGQLTNQIDFKGQQRQTRYDRFGRVTTNYFFNAGAAYPSNSVCYYYNHLGQLTNITERYGTDASSTYVAWNGGGSGKGRGRDTMWAALCAKVNRIPPNIQGGSAALLLCAFALFCIPREKRRALAECFAQAWFENVTSLLPSDGEAIGFRGFLTFLRLTQPRGTPKRFRLPHYGWRFATLITLVALIGSDPAFQPLWTARAACTNPGSTGSTLTTRITYFSYDIEGRLAQVNSPEGYINYDYDVGTGRHTRTCTGNSEMTYGYDALGRLQTVTVLKRNGTTLGSPEITTYTYTAVGSRDTVTLPNGVVTTYQYDNLNRLTNLVNKAGGTTMVSQFSYQLHGTGRRTNATEILKQEDGSWQTNTMTWQYDGLYRLTNEVCVSSVSGASYTNAFQYDKAGNRWSKVLTTATATTTITNQYNANDQLLKEVTRVGSTLTATNTYAYDANGSVITRTNSSSSSSTVLYAYDLKNKMSSVTTVGSGVTNSFQYNEQGIRVRTVTGGSTKYFLVDANNHTGYAQVLEELSTVGGTPTMSYVLGDDVLAQATSTATYLLYDGHGSTRQTANNTGAVTSRYNYDSYGTTLSTSTSSPQTSLLYCGEQYDSALGMYNLRARFYDPSNGRFNAMDTFQGSNEDPQSLHKYGYCNGDSVNGIDPTGNMTLVERLCVAAVIVISASMLLPAFVKVKKAGTLVSLIPFIGSTWDAAYEFQEGHYGWWAFYCALAISDVFLIRSLAVGGYKLLTKLGAVGSREMAPLLASASGKWASRPGGLRILQEAGYWIKEVEPAATGFKRWFAETLLEAQARALEKLGDMAPKFFYENGRLVIQDAGKFAGNTIDFLKLRWEGSLRLGEVFNDIVPRNIGSAGLIFDPALHPLHTMMLYLGYYTLGREIELHGDPAYAD